MNETFKTNQQTIEIEATATETINTKVVFWSHDKGTARLKFQLKKEGAIFPLTEGTIVPVCLLFKSLTAADGVGRHIYNATIDDAVSGLISFVLPDNILGYQGIVDGSIYIDMPNKQSLDTAGRFTFNIRRSPIDDMIPELEDYYYAGFNAVDQRIKETLAKIEKIETDFIKEMNAMQSKLNKFESDSKVQMDNIQQQITDKNLYTKKETDDLLSDVITDGQTITTLYNFRNKVTANGTANVHKMDRYGTSKTLLTPAQSGWVEATQGMYDNSLVVDGLYSTQGSVATEGTLAQILLRWNVRAQMERNYPTLFVNLGLTTVAQKSKWIRENTIRIIPQVWGRGSGLPAGENQLNVTFWNGSSWDAVPLVNDTSNVTLLSKNLPLSYLMDDGYVYVLAYGKTSNGTNQPSVALDAVQCDHRFKLDLSKFYVPQTQTATATQAGIAKVTSSFLFDDLTALSTYGGKILNDKIEGAFRFVTEKPASDLPSTYKNGITIGNASNVLGYPIPNYGNVLTIKQSTYRVAQYVFPKTMGSSIGAGSVYIRTLGSEQTEWGEWLDFLTSYDKASLVNVTDNQTIGGIKNFTAMPKLNGIDLIEDTGWVNSSWSTGISDHGGNVDNRLRFRKKNGNVEFRGIGTNSIVLSKADGQELGNIPAEFIGSNTGTIPMGAMQGSGTAIWYLAADFTNRKIKLSRYRQNTDTTWTDVPTGQWLTIHGTYLF
ncbi:hypothetical protein RV11_GL003515 [Enterococcus phoeniculicola]|uniref:BppU N-terminal domain-containing protein n=1 Tax=Enterococcus phoeniculicola ATCC BAA-412 TaxID=1158610 RepID=R3TKR0_9ENTE|nr:BppU family phage baseplate upper protein [Enterococcus phoeniculicola]EOL41989.1 hypothetical protein UC3_02337 [Enterococcus phoeniculicola ATCC BAA-412]EOT79732.1 hypothetical protein I589_01244 [Enterococcus phoeniculicola ATCC BAA-412]OJG71794.1 hypothetical protein RV11_GL003515 [Enterococcus phoeniculicola]